jgi:hypothetical protein
MDDLNDINFQSNGEFCEIRIHYNKIGHLPTVDHLLRWSTVELAI